MRVTILPKARILTEGHRATVSIMIKENSVACVLPLRCYQCLLSNYIDFYALINHYYYYNACTLTKKEYCNRNPPNP